MRFAFVVVTALGLLSLPASAAQIDPQVLVLRQADLPAGFELDRDESGVRSNAEESKGEPEVRRLFARSGRLTGYESSWENDTVKLESRADLFRRPAGARILFDWLEQEMKTVGVKGLRRAPAGVGAESWIYWGDLPGSFALVAWRHDRVFAGIAGVGLTKARALALARSQQRRIAAAL